MKTIFLFASVMWLIVGAFVLYEKVEKGADPNFWVFTGTWVTLMVNLVGRLFE